MQHLNLSQQALEVIAAVFGEKSNIQLPAGIAHVVLEVRNWAKEELSQRPQPISAQPEASEAVK